MRAREHARREELRALRHRGFGGLVTFLEVSLSVEKGLSAIFVRVCFSCRVTPKVTRL